MKYRILHNLDRDWHKGWEPGQRLADGYSGRALDLEAVFAIHNRDDRPDGKTAPSLSVGDVVLVGKPTTGRFDVAWAVQSIGFTQVSHLATFLNRTFKPYLDSID